jgi:beta-galactosidase
MSTTEPARERLSLDQGWRFAFGHPHDAAKDFGHALCYFSHLAKAGYADGAAHADFDDRAWRLLDLPHDWAVELPFASNASHSHGYKALGRGFPDTSVAWYRRRVFIPEADLGRRISVEFEGVFRDSQVFVNGFFVGREPSGYSGFRYDISDYLNYGGDNCIAVRVDATVEEGWFYEGAGIYRHVWLSKTAPLHVVAHGTCVSSELTSDSALVRARATIANLGAESARLEVSFTVLDPDGMPLVEGRTPESELAAGAEMELGTELGVNEPKLWSLESPALHTLVTRVVSKGALVDQVETRFGIRSLRFDPDHGFFLNGKHVWLKGTNNHQDHAGVGTALPDALQYFRVLALKSLGSNAYRCSHNPPTQALLDACDRLGMLVIDETRLMGSSPWQLEAMRRMILRDRNHPSVILWSLGNEEWAIEGNVKGARIASTMQAAAKRLDPTRRTTIAISGGWGRGISSVVDVMGYNYIGHGSTDRQHADFPEQPGVGTEETTTQSTRGVYVSDLARAHSAPVADGTSGGNAELGWKHYAVRPYLAGVFYWTGFDYRGESNPFGFPAISSQFGILDTCGFPKDGFYYLKAWWGEQPVLHVFPHWDWPERQGELIEVWAFSNADEVELSLNGQSLGRKPVERNGHVEWQVEYHTGELFAQSYRQGRAAESQRIETTSQPYALRLTGDFAELTADGLLAVVCASANDAQGRALPTANVPVTFAITGPGRILGVGNGDPSSHEPDRYLASLTVVDIEPFREQALPSQRDGAYPEIAPDCDDSRWPVAFQAAAASVQADTTRVLRARFRSPERPAGASVRLLLRHFGDEQRAFLNGVCVASFTQRDQAALPELLLDEAQLLRDENQLSVVATAYRDQAAREKAERSPPARLRIDGPEPTWRRSLFNGLAQVIVQSTGEPGTITLTATSPGLAKATLSAPSAPPTR